MTYQYQAIGFGGLKKPEGFLVAVGGGNRVASLLQYESSSLLQNAISTDGQNGLGRNHIEPYFRKELLGSRLRRPRTLYAMYLRCRVLHFRILASRCIPYCALLNTDFRRSPERAR